MKSGLMDSRKPSANADLNNRSRLLQAAMDAFAEQGFEGTSLRTIADNAKVSFQLIAYYFGSKEELWIGTVEYLFERHLETGKGLGFTPGGNLNEQFRNHLRLLLTDMLQRPQLHKILVQEQLANSVRYQNIIAPKLNDLFMNLALPYFREVERLGIVEKFTPEETCLIWSAVTKINVVASDVVEYMLGLPVNSPKSVEQQVDLVFGIVTERVSASPESESLTGPDPVREMAHQVQNPIPAQLPATRGVDGDPERIRKLESENQQLKQLIGSLSLEKKVLLDRLTELHAKA